MSDFAMTVLILFCFFGGIFVQWFWTWKMNVPKCVVCQSASSPHVSLALVRTHHNLEKCEIALRRLYDETADYIIVNNLGDVHHNKSMQMAREALRSCSSAALDQHKKEQSWAR